MFLAEDDSAISKIARLVLLTGQRPGQFARLHADYIQEDRIAWPAAAMKWQKRFANRQHIVPLLPMARAILQTLPSQGLLFKSRSGGEFTNWSNGKRLFDERIGLSNYTCQDCRRTTATKLGDLDVLPHVIDLLQAHRLHGTSAVHTIYNKAIYFEPMRQALQIWETRIKALLSTTENENGAELTGRDYEG
jgi:integrase